MRAVDAAVNPDVAFLRQWVRREALIKAGALTLDTMWAVDLSQSPPGEPAGGWAAHDWGRYMLADWRSGVGPRRRCRVPAHPAAPAGVGASARLRTSSYWARPVWPDLSRGLPGGATADP